MLRWLRRILTGLAAVVVLALVIAVGREQWARHRDAQKYPPPGRMVTFDGKKSHLNCTGTGSPTVILESELGVKGSLEWKHVQPEVAADTRVCSYDRAGILWSQAREEPRDANRIADELHGLLEAASVPPPYVLVGHSLGGLLIRVYDHRFPREAAGFVFVDASHPEQFERYPAPVRKLLARVREHRRSRLLTRIFAWTGLWRAFTHRPPGPVRAYLWRSMPDGYFGELTARDAMSRQAATTGTLGDRPLVVLTAGVVPRYPGVPDKVTNQTYATWLQLQDELAALSTQSLHRIVKGATHQIPEQAPDAVGGAVREVVEAVRGGKPLDGKSDS